MKKLPDVTLITVDCISLSRSKVVANICQKNFVFGSVKILSSIKDDDSRVVTIPRIKSTIEYSEFCIKEMWKYVQTDYALVFQYDGFILNPSAWTNEFLKYDYIGGLWYHMGNIKVGNGGFSLRSKHLLNLIAKNYEKIGEPFHPEDRWICKYARPFLEKEGIKFAPEEIASHFSKDGGDHGVVWDGEFGFHGLNYTDISKWLDKHPEYKDVFKQKLDDFTGFMQKYPVYDGTIHVLRSKPIQVEHYKKLSRFEKNYDCRLNDDLSELDDIKPGHKMVYKLYRISVEKVGVPTFEREVKTIEKFTSKKELLRLHPEIQITPSFYLPKWRQHLVTLFGNIIYPENKPYTLIWFEENILNPRGPIN